MSDRSSAFPGLNGQRGGTMIEVTVAVAVLVLIMSVLLSGLSTSYVSQGKNSFNATANTIARNQIEHSFAQPYLPPGSAYDTVTTPEGYTVVIEAIEYVADDPNVEKVRVTVYHQADQVLVVETLRSDY